MMVVANRAVCFHPDLEFSLVSNQGLMRLPWPSTDATP